MCCSRRRSSFYPLCLACSAILGVVKALRGGDPLFPAGIWRVVILSLPMLLIAGAMEPSQWDEFSHWLLAPRYLIEFDGFPTAERPYFLSSMLPAYPYGWPIIGYLSGQIAGDQIQNIGGVINLALLLWFSAFAYSVGWRMINGGQGAVRIGWGAAAAIGLFATILNPAFIQKIVLTAYSDTSTAVVTGFALLLAYQYAERLSGRETGSSAPLGWQLALVLALLINLRQPNLVLVVAVVLGLIILAIRDPQIHLKESFLRLGSVLILPLVVFVAWRWHVNLELSNVSNAEAALQPFKNWNIAEIPQILWSMLVVAGKKSGFFVVLGLTCVAALVGLIRYRTAFERLAILCAVAFLTYTSFLFFTYVASFSAPQAVIVVSFWRYSTHTGMGAVAVIIVVTLFAWSRLDPKPSVKRGSVVAGVALVIALPVALSGKLRFDLEPPKPYFTAVAKDLKSILPKESKFYLVDPLGTGEAAFITRYHVGHYGEAWLSAFQNPTRETVRRYLQRVPDGEHILIHSINPYVVELVGQGIEAGHSYLMKKKDRSWELIKSWPHPANHRPT